jgi:VanZ family protein
VAVAAWVALILGLGSEGFSAAATSRFLRPLLDWLLPHATPDTLRGMHLVLRKAAHVVEYGVLALLAWRASRRDLPRRLAAALTLGLLLAVAIGDEARQAGLAARTGSPRDVALDVAGGCLALALMLAPRALRRFPAPVRR